MIGKALLIGNSDGIGLATTKELLKRGWKITGISRSESPIEDSSYEHIVAEVQDYEYPEKLKSVLEKVVAFGITTVPGWRTPENDPKRPSMRLRCP